MPGPTCDDTPVWSVFCVLINVGWSSPIWRPHSISRTGSCRSCQPWYWQRHSFYQAVLNDIWIRCKRVTFYLSNVFVMLLLYWIPWTFLKNLCCLLVPAWRVDEVGSGWWGGVILTQHWSLMPVPESLWLILTPNRLHRTILCRQPASAHYAQIRQYRRSSAPIGHLDRSQQQISQWERSQGWRCQLFQPGWQPSQLPTPRRAARLLSVQLYNTLWKWTLGSSLAQPSSEQHLNSFITEN